MAGADAGYEQLKAMRDEFVRRHPEPVEIRADKGIDTYVVGTMDGYLQIAILVNELTTLESIRSNWHHIERWRQDLVEFQGPARFYDRCYFEELMRLKENGLSYQQIANEINSRLTHLVEHLYRTWFVEDYPPAVWWYFRPEGEPDRDCLLHLTGIGVLFDVFGIEEEYLDYAVEDMKEGYPPFLPGEPVSAKWVREKLRYWKDHPVRADLVQCGCFECDHGVGKCGLLFPFSDS